MKVESVESVLELSMKMMRNIPRSSWPFSEVDGRMSAWCREGEVEVLATPEPGKPSH